MVDAQLAKALLHQLGPRRCALAGLCRFDRVVGTDVDVGHGLRDQEDLVALRSVARQEGSEVHLGIVVVAARTVVEDVDAGVEGRFQEIVALLAREGRAAAEDKAATFEAGAPERSAVGGREPLRPTRCLPGSVAGGARVAGPEQRPACESEGREPCQERAPIAAEGATAASFGLGSADRVGLRHGDSSGPGEEREAKGRGPGSDSLHCDASSMCWTARRLWRRHESPRDSMDPPAPAGS